MSDNDVVRLRQRAVRCPIDKNGRRAECTYHKRQITVTQKILIDQGNRSNPEERANKSPQYF